MTFQTATVKESIFSIYLGSIIMMGLAQFGFPSMAPDALTTRVTWSLMIGIPSGWMVGFLVHRLFAKQIGIWWLSLVRAGCSSMEEHRWFRSKIAGSIPVPRFKIISLLCNSYNLIWQLRLFNRIQMWLWLCWRPWMAWTLHVRYFCRVLMTIWPNPLHLSR